MENILNTLHTRLENLKLAANTTILLLDKIEKIISNKIFEPVEMYEITSATTSGDLVLRSFCIQVDYGWVDDIPFPQRKAKAKQYAVEYINKLSKELGCSVDDNTEGITLPKADTTIYMYEQKKLLCVRIVTGLVGE